MTSSSSTASLHILLVCNLPLGNIQTSSSVKSTERLSTNIILFRLTPGTTTVFSADSSNSGIAFQVQSSNSSMIQFPEFLIWYPLPTIGGGAPQLLNNSPSAHDLLIYSAMMENETGDDVAHDSNSRILAPGQNIAVDSTNTTSTEIVVPIHSAESRRWRIGYYVLTHRYPDETIAKLLEGGDRLSSLWFSRDFESSGELPASGGGEEEDVEMEEADDERNGSSGGSTRTVQAAARKSAREARAERRRRRTRLTEDDTNTIPRRRDASGKARKALTAAGAKSRGNEVDETEDGEEEEEPEFEETDAGDGDADEEQADGSGRSITQPSPDPGLTSLSMTVPWIALAGGIRLKGQVDIVPLRRACPR
ncbi:hypothetical protein PG993_013119 [Apiospora rasikravindrae]|uniref:Uncharacterized protein n=1 Tax=Apiospora rasikravindrae TaxID=990691 RepID=A0ABR1RWQ8_9PEZI